MKYLIPLIIAVIAVFYGWWYKQEAERKDALYANSMANNRVLITRMREVYDDKLETDRRNAELEKAEKEDKTAFDWNFNIANSPVIKRLQAD